MGMWTYRPRLAVRPETRLRILQASSAIRRQRNASFLEGTTRRAPLRVHESARRGQGTEWHGHAPPLVPLLFLNAVFPNPAIRVPTPSHSSPFTTPASDSSAGWLESNISPVGASSLTVYRLVLVQIHTQCRVLCPRETFCVCAHAVISNFDTSEGRISELCQDSHDAPMSSSSLRPSTSLRGRLEGRPF